MDGEEPSSGRRKVKFAPKVQSHRKPRSIPPKTEASSTINEDDAAQAEMLMSKFSENFRRHVPKAEKKSSVQVAFGPGATSSLRKYGLPRVGDAGGSSRSDVKDSIDNDLKIVTSSSTANKDQITACPSDAIEEFPEKNQKDYIEPWDYNHTYYPTTLPLRRPYSGDPELLNEAEFGEAAKNLEHDENTINPASDLGLLDKGEKKKLFLFQLPAKLPLLKRSASAKGKERAESSTMSESNSASKMGSDLAELAEGYMGKMLVYRSGAVKLKLGSTLYDVSSGSDCIFAQDVMAINTAAKHCCTIGELGKRAVVAPDVDSLLNSVIDLG
uniref:DNA binding protein n=2 Tax=Rhizophora mucronata TaxID=61149 RepID=A0A2P2JCM0_RHIMU